MRLSGGGITVQVYAAGCGGSLVMIADINHIQYYIYPTYLIHIILHVCAKTSNVYSPLFRFLEEPLGPATVPSYPHLCASTAIFQEEFGNSIYLVGYELPVGLKDQLDTMSSRNITLELGVV